MVSKSSHTLILLIIRLHNFHKHGRRGHESPSGYGPLMLLTILMSFLSILLAQQFNLLFIKHGGNQGLYGSYIFMFSHHPVSSVKLCFVYRPREVGTAFTGAKHAPEIEKEKVEYLFDGAFLYGFLYKTS